ncbi:hypothetical protein TSUD_210110 [Trifolium subterraneum]|uniref:Uncharacterized protein n=1 Tax=Trifolium subterraneum TaxID=3900 RepID=A0A2Z6NRJ9_TRISU|nr:hypothetical protein TSUD_210110 [Trifolium subterraneum]
MLSGTEEDARMRMDDSSMEGGRQGRDKVMAKVDESKPASGCVEEYPTSHLCLTWVWAATHHDCTAICSHDNRDCGKRVTGRPKESQWPPAPVCVSAIARYSAAIDSIDS